jgi:hypothetical protein
MADLTEIMTKSVNHRKECQECTDQNICDEMVKINAEALEKSIFG